MNVKAKRLGNSIMRKWECAGGWMNLLLLLSAVFRFCSKTVEMEIGFWVPVLLLLSGVSSFQWIGCIKDAPRRSTLILLLNGSNNSNIYLFRRLVHFAANFADTPFVHFGPRF